MAFLNFTTLRLYFILSFTFISTSISNPIILELSPIPKLCSTQNPKEIISNIAKSTLQRAHHLRSHNKNPSKLVTSTPLFSKSMGDYSIFLSLETPPQKIPAFFDTGSSLVWVPCTSNYLCSNCIQNNDSIVTYLPNKSSSKHSIKCNNKKCHWLDQPEIMASCPNCARILPGSCTRPCSYTITYGDGDTSGFDIFENLNLNNKVVPNFFVGCSLISDMTPEGIAGFGRSPISFPNQLKLSKFSYCLISYKYDENLKNSSLILGDYGVIPGLKYTPLLKNPPTLPFNQYYYVHLEKIKVGKKFVKIPRDIHVPNMNGDGGTIVDSGSTLTTLAPNVFDPIVEEFVDQMNYGQQKRVEIVQSSVGDVLCMNIEGRVNMAFPEVVFQFKGGVKMDLTVDNYTEGGENLLCLPFVNASFAVGQGGNGPAIILGNYQQQNVHIEYDLKNERLGLKKHNCRSRL